MIFVDVNTNVFVGWQEGRKGWIGGTDPFSSILPILPILPFLP